VILTVRAASASQVDLAWTTGVSNLTSFAIRRGTSSNALTTLTTLGSVLAYNLYLDSTRLTIWGDGTGGTGTFSGMGTGSDVGTTVYGRIPAGQNVAVGTYSDLITVTVTF